MNNDIKNFMQKFCLIKFYTKKILQYLQKKIGENDKF